jgi:hypothetical protein
MAQTLQRPVGSGWSSSGWVHNDLLQISAGQGVLAAALYVGTWLYLGAGLLGRLLSLRRVQLSTYLPEGLLIALLASGGVMVTQGVTWLAHLALPIWLVWMLASVWLYQFQEAYASQVEARKEEAFEAWKNPLRY